MRLKPILHGLLLVAVLAADRALGQAVKVSVVLDNPQIQVGGSTTLHVYAQILPTLQANTDRIFSWYVDLLDANSAVATNKPAQLSKPASDKDPATSSLGLVNGANILGISDTFLNRPDAGRTNLVELFNVPITGVSTGQTTFSVQAGTTLNLGADFLVAPKGGGDALKGGDYSTASISLNVVPPSGAFTLKISRQSSGPLLLTFPVIAGQNYFVESRDDLGAAGSWQALPNGPQNSGSVQVVVGTANKFYRVRVAAP